MTAEEFGTLLSDLPPDESKARARTFLECARHLVVASPTVEGKYRRYILEYIAGAFAIMGYGADPSKSLHTVYSHCIKFGIPKHQMDALVALHLT